MLLNGRSRHLLGGLVVVDLCQGLRAKNDRAVAIGLKVHADVKLHRPVVKVLHPRLGEGHRNAERRLNVLGRAAVGVRGLHHADVDGQTRLA